MTNLHIGDCPAVEALESDGMSIWIGPRPVEWRDPAPRTEVVLRRASSPSVFSQHRSTTFAAPLILDE
eukprot:CAMPEP_0183346530 /NCGR_PEP_ID=MMETSP0164_2-20130417/11624_1 /TAXON_ID=221442 /ORGANISM="Coccolithus pelagicus ssp braarudi, Strain PLY182g" /LENGTH=67 /DNA_ID=CAMNT_0025517819 /DNA_START=240 /DNA_END=443 /DNA_ORIENTATION=+